MPVRSREIADPDLAALDDRSVAPMAPDTPTGDAASETFVFADTGGVITDVPWSGRQMVEGGCHSHRDGIASAHAGVQRRLRDAA